MAQFHLSVPVRYFQLASTHNTRASPKWNAAFIKVIEYTCAFPAMKCPLNPPVLELG